MMAAALSLGQALDQVSSLASSYVTAACHNRPSNVTISGDSEAIQELKARLDSQGVFNRILMTEAAYHSRHTTVISKIFPGIQAAKDSRVSFSSFVTSSRYPSNLLGPQYISNVMKS